jgi:hypothetical protein
MADLIQMGATVATVACPLGPRIRSFVGRKDSPMQATDGLLPDVNAPADSLIQLFEDKTIKPHGLAALVGAHTTSQQRFFQPQRALDPQDSSPGVWDVLFYGQTLDPNPPKRVLKFPSDIVLSTHPRIASEWKDFAASQDHWNDVSFQKIFINFHPLTQLQDFAKEYVRLSMLGVFNINNLTECTKVLPPAIKGFSPPDKSIIDKWANGGFQQLGQRFGQLMADGQTTTNQTLQSMGIDPTQANFGFGMPPPGAPGGPPPGFGNAPRPSQPSIQRPPPQQNAQQPPQGQPQFGRPGSSSRYPRDVWHHS